MRIVHLLEAPQAEPKLVRWFCAEWEPWYGTGGLGDAAADLAACSNRGKLPICLVALQGEELLGTAALRIESVGSELAVGPWLAAVLVAPEHRSKGVGRALVAAIEEVATGLGYAAIYTSTDTARGILERRGWQIFGASESLRGPVTIYRWQANAGG